MKSKKVLKAILLSFVILLLGVGCKAPSKSEPLPSIGTLKATPESSTITLTKPINGIERSGAITISGFNDKVKTEVKDTIDVLYTITDVVVTGVQVSSAEETERAVPSKEDVQKAISEGSFMLVESDNRVFDEIQVAFAHNVDGQTQQQNAQKIAAAIGEGNTASISLKVEASANANIEGKYESSTFTIRLGIIVSK